MVRDGALRVVCAPGPTEQGPVRQERSWRDGRRSDARVRPRTARALSTLHPHPLHAPASRCQAQSGQVVRLGACARALAGRVGDTITCIHTALPRVHLRFYVVRSRQRVALWTCVCVCGTTTYRYHTSDGA
eukprot:925011-Prymnesium_polylepis.1